MKRHALLIAIASFGCVFTLQAQRAPQPRRILFDTFVPILSRILPGDQWIVVTSGNPAPAFASVAENAVVSEIVRHNPIIFTGRLVEKRPLFLRRRAGERSTEVIGPSANWIGSRVTMTIDRIIQTVDALPLTTLQRLTFVEEGDGSTGAEGVRIDTETPWLEPLEEGRRYLITGRIRNGEFSSTGQWMEPADGGPLRSRVRAAQVEPVGAGPNGKPKRLFEGVTLGEAARQLEDEARRRRSTSAL